VKFLQEPGRTLKCFEVIFASSTICDTKVAVFCYHFGILSALLVKKEEMHFSKVCKLERNDTKKKKKRKKKR